MYPPHIPPDGSNKPFPPYIEHQKMFEHGLKREMSYTDFQNVLKGTAGIDQRKVRDMNIFMD